MTGCIEIENAGRCIGGCIVARLGQPFFAVLANRIHGACDRCCCAQAAAIDVVGPLCLERRG